MRVQYFFPVLILILNSCDTETDNGLDCRLFDHAFETILIEFLDSDGNNLIENGTYDRDKIRLIYNGNSVGFVDNNILTFETIGNQETLFTVVLKDSESDTLTLNVTSTLGPCDITFYTAESAWYNSEDISIGKINDYTKSITVVK